MSDLWDSIESTIKIICSKMCVSDCIKIKVPYHTISTSEGTYKCDYKGNDRNKILYFCHNDIYLGGKVVITKVSDKKCIITFENNFLKSIQLYVDAYICYAYFKTKFLWFGKETTYKLKSYEKHNFISKILCLINEPLCSFFQNNNLQDSLNQRITTLNNFVNHVSAIETEQAIISQIHEQKQQIEDYEEIIEEKEEIISDETEIPSDVPIDLGN